MWTNWTLQQQMGQRNKILWLINIERQMETYWSWNWDTGLSF